MAQTPRLLLHAVLLALAALVLQALASSQAQERAECMSTPEICGQMAAFGGSLIVPQVIPKYEPLGMLHLFYDDHKIDVGGAQQLPPERVAKAPIVSFNRTRPLQTGPPYILVMLDPDASAIHTGQACALHWMLTDVFFDEESGHMTSGFVSAKYSRPNPPESPLHHRYVVLLFEQPPLFLPPIFSHRLAGARLHFNLPLFLRDYGIPSPIGGQFFKSWYTGAEVPEEEPQRSNPEKVVIKAQSSPWLAGIIGSVLGLLYGASS